MTREEWDKLHPQDKKEIINILEWKKQWLAEMKRKNSLGKISLAENSIVNMLDWILLEKIKKEIKEKWEKYL